MAKKTVFSTRKKISLICDFCDTFFNHLSIHQLNDPSWATAVRLFFNYEQINKTSYQNYKSFVTFI